MTTLEAEVRLRLLELEIEKREATEDPSRFLDRVKCVDAKTGETFQFHLNEPDSGWYWQRDVLDSWLSCDRNLTLKARQIGITWLAAGLGLWYAIYQRAARILIISINEVEAIKVVNRIWDMWLSLPEHLQNERKVIKPTRGARPTTEIGFMAADGSASSILAMPATETAGHGETATLVILDEYARQEYAAGTWKSTFPTIDGGGRVLVISTANGVSNPNTGEGNYFHYLYVNASTLGIQEKFLGWYMHPDRDDEWYMTKANALPPHERAEQYPSDPEEAFIHTGECWFDLDALAHYSKLGKEVKPLHRMRFREMEGKAEIIYTSGGELRVYRKPEPGERYALAADVATGRGSDFSAAYVVSLDKPEFVAEYHGSIDADLYATQLFYVGRYYNDAWLAIEMGGGFGEAVVNSLRDGRGIRPPYRNLYRHVVGARIDWREHQTFGYPMTNRTRGQVLNVLESFVRERSFAFVPPDLVNEMRTFVTQRRGPSPRAQDGCNDDRVMSAAIVCEMYRQKGFRPVTRKRRKKKQSWKDALYAHEKK